MLHPDRVLPPAIPVDVLARLDELLEGAAVAAAFVTGCEHYEASECGFVLLEDWINPARELLKEAAQ